MADFLVLLIESQSGWTMIIGIMSFLALEFALDIIHDLVMDKIRDRKSKNE